MKFIQLKVTSFIKRNTEVFLLILLLVVSSLIIQIYNSQSKKVDDEYIKILRNTYFKKTINHIFFNLTPRFEQIDYSVKSGQTLEDILKEFSVKDEEIKKIFAVLSKNETKKIRSKQTLNIVLDNTDKNNKKILSLLIPVSKTRKIQITKNLETDQLKKEEIVQGAFESGCIGLHIGIESGNPEILKQIRKPGTVDTFIAASEVLSKFPKINTRALLMLGFPNETLSMIFDTIELAENINFDWANLSILQPWKGTPIYEEMADAGLIGDKEGTLKTEDNEKAPYQLGTYSRQRAIESGKIVEKSDFKEIKNEFLNRIEAKSLDIIPSAKDLDNLWFYMNFRINFSRLLREFRPEKIYQQYRFLKHITTKIGRAHV